MGFFVYKKSLIRKGKLILQKSILAPWGVFLLKGGIKVGIRVKELHVNYGEKEIIRNISFQVDDGEIVTIIGPNGSGKSTILKAISRCLKPVKGKIY